MPSFRASVEEHAKNVRACAGEEARRGRFDKAEAQELAESQRGLAPRRGGRQDALHELAVVRLRSKPH